LAMAMVDAVARALMQGTPLPDGTLTFTPGRSAAPAYVPEPMRLAPGSRIQTTEREVRILARGMHPSLAVLGNLLSASECDRLIAAARPRLLPSQVVEPNTGRDVIAQYRSSEGMFFRPRENPLVERIEQRIAQLTGLPLENGEGIQILRYPVGAESTPHFDYLVPSNDTNRASIARSGQRIATLIIYLNDVAGGGETTFPSAGSAVVPQKGNAVYFEYGNSLGQTDPASLHAGEPVTVGEKWIATKWLRNRKFVSR
jgi:prolyl 4-hydroxylase